MSALEARVSLINEKVQFRGIARGNAPVIMDYIPPFGDSEGYMALELLLMSLGTCASTAVATLLRRMGRQVTAFDANASGTRREEHPKCFDSIHLHFTLTSPDAAEEEMQKAIDLSEQSVCPVWAMLKGNVIITTGFDIIRSN
jgi:putative redox protein